MRVSQLKFSSNLDLINVISCGELTSHSNPLVEIRLVKNGMKASGVYAFANAMGWNMTTIANALGTTSATLSRSKAKLLSSQTSEHALEVAKLSMSGIDYFGNIKNWNAWLNTAHIQFNGRSPQLVLNSIRGRELIKNIIKQLKHGFTA
ncbi:DUF2384 domain-containing protein [Pseudoalteromonas gelatinilytica]|uniref:DUF2384 domain-containing protein n=2 Tax=Pseudoalteromonas gelatinilytica TaxID=1703256 RepID=A0A3A3EJV8_9GAMM|nr:DUF2384 domain-containing protein [Pseudoalteromonas profundi]